MAPVCRCSIKPELTGSKYGKAYLAGKVPPALRAAFTAPHHLAGWLVSSRGPRGQAGPIFL